MQTQVSGCMQGEQRRAERREHDERRAATLPPSARPGAWSARADGAGLVPAAVTLPGALPGGGPLPTVLVPSARPGLYCRVLKRWLDAVGALCLLVVFSPLLAVIALAIWVTSGRPIIFRQTRIGQYGRPFVVYKFRTMRPDRRRRQQPYHGPERRKRHKTAHDPRVTPVGRFLRRTSLDELPQLINVLRGDMSLVGPRPELPDIVARYEPWQHERHLVRPGLTGWWQVQSRGDQLMHERTDLDVYYVRNQSFRLDLEILIRTIPSLVSRAGAF